MALPDDGHTSENRAFGVNKRPHHSCAKQSMKQPVYSWNTLQSYFEFLLKGWFFISGINYLTVILNGFQQDAWPRMPRWFKWFAIGASVSSAVCENASMRFQVLPQCNLHDYINGDRESLQSIYDREARDILGLKEAERISFYVQYHLHRSSSQHCAIDPFYQSPHDYEILTIYRRLKRRLQKNSSKREQIIQKATEELTRRNHQDANEQLLKGIISWEKQERELRAYCEKVILVPSKKIEQLVASYRILANENEMQFAGKNERKGRVIGMVLALINAIAVSISSLFYLSSLGSIGTFLIAPFSFCVTFYLSVCCIASIQNIFGQMGRFLDEWNDKKKSLYALGKKGLKFLFAGLLLSSSSFMGYVALKDPIITGLLFCGLTTTLAFPVGMLFSLVFVGITFCISIPAVYDQIDKLLEHAQSILGSESKIYKRAQANNALFGFYAKVAVGFFFALLASFIVVAGDYFGFATVVSTRVSKLTMTALSICNTLLCKLADTVAGVVVFLNKTEKKAFLLFEEKQKDSTVSNALSFLEEAPSKDSAIKERGKQRGQNNRFSFFSSCSLIDRKELSRQEGNGIFLSR